MVWKLSQLGRVGLVRRLRRYHFGDGIESVLRLMASDSYRTALKESSINATIKIHQSSYGCSEDLHTSLSFLGERSNCSSPCWILYI